MKTVEQLNRGQLNSKNQRRWALIPIFMFVALLVTVQLFDWSTVQLLFAAPGDRGTAIRGYTNYSTLEDIGESGGTMTFRGTAISGSDAAYALNSSSYQRKTGDGSGLTGLTKSQVGLGNVDNTSDANKPVSTAQQNALDLKLTKSVFDGWSSSKQAASSNLTTYAGLPPSANAQTLLGETFAEMLASIGAAASGHNHSGVYQPVIDSSTDLTVKSLTVAKQQSIAGINARYEGYSTNTQIVGEIGPASMSANQSYLLRDPAARATAANQVKACTNAGETGTGTSADPYIQACAWATPLLASALGTGVETALGNATNGTGGVVTYGGNIGAATGTSLSVTGTLQGRVTFNSYTSAQALTASTHNGSVVQMTIAGEVTMWDCETANVGDFVTLWARDAEKIEVVPPSGDHFNLFDGTALTANNELDMAATAGTKVTLMCTADDTWSVYNETAASTDGGAAD